MTITSRTLEIGDLDRLADSLQNDPYHRDTPIDFFVAFGSMCNVYEDERGPICFVRGVKSLRLDIQYVDNADLKRNMQAMIDGFPALMEKAKQNGFSEVVFNTSSPLLKRFCVRRLGFTHVEGDELRRVL